MVGFYQYYYTSTALVGYLFGSFGRVLDFKSRDPGSISTFPLFPLTVLTNISV